jgi:hypothetical protein
MSEEQQAPTSTRSPARGEAGGGEIRMRLDPGEPISGTLISSAESTRFCGWMELIAAITAARGQPQPPGG